MSEIPPGVDPAAQPIPGIAPEVDLGPETPAAGPTTVFHGDRSVTYTQPQVTTPHLQAADYPSESGIYNKEDAARAAGYTWNEIDQHIGPAQVAAQDAGYTQDEINEYLGYASPDAMVSRNTTTWAQVQHYDPKTLQPTSDGALDLTANPNWKGDYASALLRGEVKGPKDFADNYAASALNAAGASGQLAAAGAAGADKLAAQLPSRRDLTDGALSLGGAFDTAKQNLMDHWQETGQPPLDAAIKAQTDPALNAKLTTQPAPNLPWWAQGDPEAQTAADVSEAIAPALSDAFHRYSEWRFAQPDAKVKWGDWKEQLKSNPDELTGIALGLGGAGIERVGETLESALFPKADIVSRLRHQFAIQTNPAAITALFPKITEALDHLPEPKTDVIDLSKPPGEAVTQAPVSEALAPVKAAVRQKPEPIAEGAPVTTTTTVEEKPLPFEETATPAEKVEALAQDALGGNTKANMADVLNAKADQLETMRLTREGHLPDEFDRPNLFQELAKNEDPATQELAKGYDAAGGLAKFFQQTLPNIFRSEAGEVPVGLGALPKTLAPGEVAPGSLLAYRTGQNVTETLVRMYATGRARAQIAATASALDALRPRMAPHLSQWMDALEDWRNDRPGVAPWETVYGKLIGHMENVPGFKLADNDPLIGVANELRRLNDWKYRWLQDAADRGLMGEDGVVNYVEGYWRHNWEDPNQASRIFGSGTQGSSATLKHRTVPTIFDGLKEGLIPVDKDPLNVVLRDLSGSFRHIAALDILNDAKNLNWTRWKQNAEPTDIPLTGLGSTRIIPLKDAVTGEPAGSTIEHLMAHPGFANTYNKWAGAIDLPLNKTAQFFGRLKNTVAGYYLAVPIFHAWTMFQTVVGGGYGRMFRNIMHNEYGEAADQLAKNITMAWPAVDTYKAGREFQKRYLKFGNMEPGEVSDDPLISAIVQAGGGASKDPADIMRPGIGPDLFTAARQGLLRNQIRELVGRVFTKDAMGKPTMNIMAIPSAAADAFDQVTGTINAPLFEHAIPILKDGVNMQAAEEILRRGAKYGTDPNLVALQIRQAVKNTDDRMGEMLKENLFWSRGLKTFSHLTMLSTNWVYGEVRQAAAAVGIQLQGKGTHWAWNEHAATNLVGTLFGTAIMGGLYTWLKTGAPPKDPMDVTVPRSGGRSQGAEVRVVQPGGHKEFLDLGKIAANTIVAGQDDGAQAALLAFTEGSADWMFGKRNNVLAAISALATGHEYPGGPNIAHEPGQLGGYLTRDLALPIVLQNMLTPIPGTTAVERLLTGVHRASVLEENYPRWRNTMRGVDRKLDASEIARARRALQRQQGE